MAPKTKLDDIISRPLEVIQFLIALSILCIGFYLISPFYVSPNQQSAFGDGMVLRASFAVIFFIVPAVSTFLGLKFHRFRSKEWRARGCFYMANGIFILTALRIISIGIVPPIWIFYLTEGLIAGVLYLYWKVKG